MKLEKIISIFKFNYYLIIILQVTIIRNYDKSFLDNGIKVVSKKINHIKSISIGIWINVGSRDETIHNNGITHFIEHSVFKGTKRRSAKAISISLEQYGGYHNAFTTKEMTCYYAKALPEQMELAFEVLSDFITSPTFPEKEIEKEKNVVIEEITTYQDNPIDFLSEEFDKYIFQKHPLGFPISGTTENVKKFTRKDLFDFMENFYIPKNIMVVAIGNLEHEKVVNLSEKYLGKLKPKNNNYKRKRPELNSISKQFKLEKDINQIHICLGRKTFGIENKDRLYLAALNTYLGDGASSKLFLNIREKYGIAYNLFSFLNGYYDSSVFGVFTTTAPKNYQKAIDLIWLEIEKFKKQPLKPTTLKKFKQQLKGSIVLNYESIASISTHLAQSEFYFNEARPIDDILSDIDKLTEENLFKIANDLLQREHFTEVILFPKNKLMDY